MLLKKYQSHHRKEVVMRLNKSTENSHAFGSVLRPKRRPDPGKRKTGAGKKGLAALFFSVLMILSLAACGGPTGGNNDNASVPQSADEPKTETVGKALVVYYSATGNTEDVANYIAEATDADIFELEPTEPYSDEDLDWTDDNSRVVYEHDHPDDRAVELVAAAVDDWESYDTVFIGYPIWWGIAAWPVDGFIEANDFTGKTVIPFCTSSSSGLGESGELLEEAAGTGNWLDGERFSSGASEEDVRTWIGGLGL